MSYNKTPDFYATVYFPETDPRIRDGRILRFRDETSAGLMLRGEGFTYCPTHQSWAKLDTITVNDGRRCRVEAVKVDTFTEGWRLNYAAAERGAR